MVHLPLPMTVHMAYQGISRTRRWRPPQPPRASRRPASLTQRSRPRGGAGSASERTVEARRSEVALEGGRETLEPEQRQREAGREERVDRRDRGRQEEPTVARCRGRAERDRPMEERRRRDAGPEVAPDRGE